MMNPSATTDASSVRSPLDKPLGELTEEDIAQLTREDCRRFLKQKGMRRPSWNKSQAIQQVISLKALLEDRPDSALRKTPKSPPPPTPLPPVSVPATRVVEDPSPYRRRDPNPNPNPIGPSAIFTCAARAAAADEVVAGREHQLPSPRFNPFTPSAIIRDDPAQMTIFYGGRVNVYNNVPVDKARVIMQIAAAPLDLNEPPPEPVHASLMVRPGCTTSPVGPPEWIRSRECEDSTVGYTDYPTGRQTSLQRYREKRKDRYKGKRIIGGSPLSMEMMFLSKKFSGQTPDEQSSPSNMSSPTQPRPPCTPTRCSSVENQAQKFRISVDLNDDGGGN